MKIDALEFDGRLDPGAFMDWMYNMEYYFEWYQMNYAQPIRFTKMKLVGSAKHYWQIVQHNIK